MSSEHPFRRAPDPNEPKVFDPRAKGECCVDVSVDRGIKATDSASRSKDFQTSGTPIRANFPIPQGPRSMFPTRSKDVLTGCNTVPIGRHLPLTQTRGIEVQIPMRKNNLVPRWHVGHSEWQRRRELVCRGLIINYSSLTDRRDQSAWRVGGTYSNSGDSDDMPTTISANGRGVSTIPSYEFYGTSQPTAKHPTSLTGSSTITDNQNSSLEYQRLSNSEATSSKPTFLRIQQRISEKSGDLIAPADCSEQTSNRQNPNAPEDLVCSSSQTVTKKRRHMRQDSRESGSLSRHQTKRVKSTDPPKGSPDHSAEDSGDAGQLDINSRNLAGVSTSSQAGMKGKGRATQSLVISSPSGRETSSSDPAHHNDSSPAANTGARSLTPSTLDNTSNTTTAPRTNDAHFDNMKHDSFPSNLDEDPETIDLQRLQPFPSLPARTALNSISLNIPAMRFRSMPPPRAMGPPLHRRLLPPQVSDVIPLNIKESVQKALKECLQENQGALQAFLPQPQPVIVNPLPLPGVVRQRGDTHYFGNLDQEQVTTMVKNPNLGRAVRYSSAPNIFTYKGTVRENYQWLGAEGLFTEPEWKRVGGKMKNFRPRVE